MGGGGSVSGGRRRQLSLRRAAAAARSQAEERQRRGGAAEDRKRNRDPLRERRKKPHTTMLQLSIFLLLLSHFHGFSLAKFEYSNCSSTEYEEGTTYESNLSNLLSSLYQNAMNHSAFYDTSFGSAPNEIYGLAMCFVDSSPADCASCLQYASYNTTQPCPASKTADIFYDNCLFRYSNQNFTSELSTVLNIANKATCFYNDKNVTNSTAAKNSVTQLMGNLRKIASNSSQKFASGMTNGTNFTGLVQCARDLSSEDCDKCIANAFNYMSLCSNNWTSQGMRIIDLSCYVRYESYLFNATAFPRLLNSSLPPIPSVNGGRSKSKLVVAVTISVSAALIILIAVGILFWKRRQKLHKKREHEQSPVFVQDNAESTLEYILHPNVEYQVFDLTTLQNATENFSDTNKLGRGGFGTVYKGLLPDGKEIAVKRLSGNSTQGIRELKNEVNLLAKLKHKNLVLLYGCCIQKEEKLLCYEYVTNGSLDKILFAKDGSKNVELDWRSRYRLIEGIGRGLFYLHEESRLKIVHRDLKGSNILLDKDMNPKISDFGLARFFEEDQTHKETSIVAGTFGYMAPEYVLHGNYSIKADVYSFGVLLLEIVTGKRNSSFSGSSRISNVISYALQHWSSETINQLKDPKIEDIYLEEVKKCVHIALLCVQDKPMDRPNMEAVNLMLSGGYSKTLPPLPSGWQITRILDMSLSDDYSTTQSSVDNSRFSY
ncbi:hypothetical protein LUZ60_005503 [Juncus effusus]|nr:hypothetical protein LUZ60_005503 [Juncus effusus]